MTHPKANRILVIALLVGLLAEPTLGGESQPSDSEPDARAYAEMAEDLVRQERQAEAVELLRRAIALGENEPLREVQPLARYHGRLATLYLELERPDLAELEERQALALREEYYGPRHRQLIFGLRRLADLLVDQERYSEATEPLQRAAAIAERTLGDDSSTTTKLRRSLAALERLIEGEGDAALVDYRADQGDTVGCGCRCSSHPELAELLDRGKTSEAAELAEEYVADAEAEYGFSSFEVATALEALASVHEELDPSITTAAHERRLKILRLHLGSGDPRIADTALRLAHLYRVRRDAEKAMAAYRLRVESLETAGRFTVDLANALRGLASMQVRLSDPVAAAESYGLSAQLWQEIAGSLAPETIQAHHLWAAALMHLEDFHRAERILLELADELEQIGPRSQSRSQQLDKTLSELERLLYFTGRKAEARRIEERRLGR